MNPLEPAILISAILAFTLVGLIAAWVPARRAASIDPIQARRAQQLRKSLLWYRSDPPLNRARAAAGTRGAIAVWIRETGDLVRTGIAARLVTTNAPSGKEGNVMNVWMDDLRNAFRSLRKSPMYTLFAIGTLTMGIGATTTLFSTLDRVLLRPVDSPEADRLVSIMRSRGPMLSSPTPETLTRLRETDGVFDLLSAMKTEGMTLSTEQGAVYLSGVRIDENLLTMAGVTRPVGGRLFLDGGGKGSSSGGWRPGRTSNPGAFDHV